MTLHIVGMLAVMAGMVILLRWVPFLLFPAGRRVPELLLYLGRTVTAAAIAMLVVYSLYGSLEYSTLGMERIWAGLCASALTVGLHTLLKNPLVSIVSGTALFMWMIRN